MIKIHGRSTSLMILFAIALHFSWAMLLFIDDSATNATAVNALFRYIHPPIILAATIAVAAGMALMALVLESTWFTILLLPQQMLLMMSASGTIEAVWLAQFADGVIRSRAFIAADQIYSILAVAGHTTAIIMHALRTRNAK